MSKLVGNTVWIAALIVTAVWFAAANGGEKWLPGLLGVMLVIGWSAWGSSSRRSHHGVSVDEQQRVDDRPPHERIPAPIAVGR